jgi:hypothetical protein
MSVETTKPENTTHQEMSFGERFDYEAYSDVSKAAELHEIKLIESHYTIKPEVFSVIQDFEAMNHGFVGEGGSLNYDSQKGVALGDYRWAAEIKHGRKKVLKLVANYLVVYTELHDFDETHVRFFFNKVGRFATYPYFRALFSHHTAESGILLPPLPTLSERVN